MSLGAGLRAILLGNYRVVYRLRAKRVEILTLFEGSRLLRKEEVEGDD